MSRWDHLIRHQLEFLNVGIEEFENEDWTKTEACERMNTSHFENLKFLILSASPTCRLHLLKIGFNMNLKLGLVVVHAFWVLNLDPCPRMNVRESHGNFQPVVTENTLITFPNGKVARCDPSFIQLTSSFIQELFVIRRLLRKSYMLIFKSVVF